MEAWLVNLSPTIPLPRKISRTVVLGELENTPLKLLTLRATLWAS